MGKSKKAKNDDKENLFYVEKTLAKRVRNGKTEYLVKWQDYDEFHNSWEPESHLTKECIEDYEINMKPKRFVSKRKISTDDDHTTNINHKKKCLSPEETKLKRFINPENLQKGIICNQEPEKIIGATDITGELVFLVKYTNCDSLNLIPAKVANSKFPQIVISFYESNSVWKDQDSQETV